MQGVEYIYTPAGFEEGLMENAAKAESLSLPPKGLKPSPFGWRHVDVDITPVDLMSYHSDKNTSENCPQIVLVCNEDQIT